MADAGSGSGRQPPISFLFSFRHGAPAARLNPRRGKEGKGAHWVSLRITGEAAPYWGELFPAAPASDTAGMQFHRNSVRCAARTATARSGCLAAGPARRRPVRVLVADDELFAHAALRLLLRDETDFELVGSATDGAEAVDAIYRLKPELVFLDVNMPELDGFEVLRRINPARRPAVILTTGDARLAERAFEIKAVDYLVKPYSRARFRVALNRARGFFRQRNSPVSHSVEP